MGRIYHDLKVIMYDRKVTQEVLAEVIGISEVSLNARLNGRKNFTIPEAEKIVEYLCIDDPIKIFFNQCLRGA